MLVPLHEIIAAGYPCHQRVRIFARDSDVADDSFEILFSEALGHLDRGQSARAHEILVRLRAMRPDSAEVARALGEANYGLGRLAAAREACAEATRLMPEYERAHFLLGVIQAQSGQLTDAVSSFRQAIRIRPDYPDAVRALAATLHADEQYAQALDCYLQALEMGIDDTSIRLECATVAEHAGSIDEAIRQRQEIQHRDPDDVENAYNLAALTGTAPPPVAPRTMVVETFDRYAETFDDHLCQQLGYRGPELLLDAVQRFGLEPESQILDLGCGTGLCGMAFRDYASRLVGVDLSREMLTKARARGIYDELYTDDVMDFLRRDNTFDLALAGDLFIYLGDLSRVFAALARVLRSGAGFAFTLERDDAAPLRVNRAHRYTHSHSYLIEMAEQSAFRVHSVEDHTLRRHGTNDVPGMIVVLERE